MFQHHASWLARDEAAQPLSGNAAQSFKVRKGVRPLCSSGTMHPCMACRRAMKQPWVCRALWPRSPKRTRACPTLLQHHACMHGVQARNAATHVLSGNAAQFSNVCKCTSPLCSSTMHPCMARKRAMKQPSFRWESWPRSLECAGACTHFVPAPCTHACRRAMINLPFIEKCGPVLLSARGRAPTLYWHSHINKSTRPRYN